MLRRNPTKIELKLEDLQELESKLKGDSDTRKIEKIEGSSESTKTCQEIIEERIGCLLAC